MMDALDLHQRFTYHPPKDDQPDRYQLIRQHAHGLAGNLPACSRQSEVILKKPARPLERRPEGRL